MAAYVLFLVVLGVLGQVVCCMGKEQRREGFVDGLSSGMQFAKDILGSESVALKVAEFVVRAFQPGNNPHAKPNRRRPFEEPYEEVSSEHNIVNERPEFDNSSGERPELYGNEVNDGQSAMAPLRHLVRLFGLQPNQISAVAVNALVFVAQMISTFLAGPKRPTRPHRSDDLTSWILNKNSRELQDLLAAAKNESLPDTIEDLVKDQGTEETSCIRLLLCKITPFVFKMQKTVFEEAPRDDEKVRGSAALYRHLPSAEEVNVRNGVCEQRHRDCDLNE